MGETAMVCTYFGVTFFFGAAISKMSFEGFDIGRERLIAIQSSQIKFEVSVSTLRAFAKGLLHSP
jgi:hypothetical protein